jgi:hypothetical protein
VDELSPVRFEHHREALGIGEEVFRVASAQSVLVG